METCYMRPGTAGPGRSPDTVPFWTACHARRSMPVMTTQSPPAVEPAGQRNAVPPADAPRAQPPDARVDRAAAAIGPLLKALGDRRDFAVRLWDGRGFRAPNGTEPRFTLVIRRPGALARMLLPPTDLAIGEAYVHGDFDVKGDIFAFVSLPDRLGGLPLGVP